MKYVLFILLLSKLAYGIVSENTYYYSEANAVYEQCAEMGVYPDVAILPNDFGGMSYVIAYQENYASSKDDQVIIPIVIVGNISSQTDWASDILMIMFNHSTFTITTHDCRYVYSNVSIWSARQFNSKIEELVMYDEFGMLDH